MIGKGSETFKLVFDEKYHMIYLGKQYRIISKPKQVEDGYEYIIEEI